MRTVYKYNQKTGQVEPVLREEAGERVHIISDNLGDTYWNPAYLKSDPNAWTSSRSKFQELTRRAGRIEVGNESLEVKPEQPRPYDVYGAVQRAKRFLKYKNDW